MRLFHANKTFLLIILLGALLRLSNLNIGSPILFLSNDEAIYHFSALNMLAEKTVFSLGNYGPLGAYIQLPFIAISYLFMLLAGVVGSIWEMELLLVTKEGYLLFIPRVISAIFGMMSIIAVYFLAKLLFNNDKTASLHAAFYATVSFNLVHISHLARAWSPAIFFVLMSALFAIKSKARAGSRLFAVLSFASAATSFGFHQVAGISILLVLLIFYFLKKFSFSGLVLWCLMVIIFGFLSTGSNFFNLVNPTVSGAGLMKIPRILNSENLLSHFTNTTFFLTFFKELFLSDGVIAFMAIIFLIAHRKGLFCYPFLWFILINIALSIYVYIPLFRYFLPAFIFMPVFAGKLSSFLWGTRWKFLVAVLLFVSSFNSVYWNLLLLNTPTFDQVRLWIDRNIPKETYIASTERRNFDYVPNATASKPIRDFKPGYYQKAAKLLGRSFTDNVRNVVYSNEFGDGKWDNLEKALILYPQIAFIIDNYYDPKESLMRNNTEKFLLIKRFLPTKQLSDKELPSLLFDSGFMFTKDYPHPLLAVERPGPYFDILKLK